MPSNLIKVHQIKIRKIIGQNKTNTSPIEEEIETLHRISQNYTKEENERKVFKQKK